MALTDTERQEIKWMLDQVHQLNVSERKTDFEVLCRKLDAVLVEVKRKPCDVHDEALTVIREDMDEVVSRVRHIEDIKAGVGKAGMWFLGLISPAISAGLTALLMNHFGKR